MKVSYEDLREIRSVVCNGARGDAVVAELLALREVADEASSMLQMAYANGEERAKWERLMGALVRSGR